MDQLGYLDDGSDRDQNCLSHLDLRGQNIMIDIGKDRSLEITGILDWDSANVCSYLRWVLSASLAMG